MDCNSAIVREVPTSFANALQMESKPIDFKVAYSQHQGYIKTLQKYLNVEVLDPLNDSPDACFVEDTCVVIGKKAVINHIGVACRRKEVKTAEEQLRKLGLEVVVMPETINCDGGDVLYTGKNIFVGISKRTSREAVKFFNHFFKIPTFAIDLDKNCNSILHLKSSLGLLGPNTLSCLDDENGRYTLTQILKIEKLDVVFASSQILANTLSFIKNNKLIVFVQVVPGTDILQRDIRSKFPNCVIETVDMSELAKADGALTCCSVLIQ
eukprot:NODE_143_length_17796_cov_0.252020.p7 type:complete len:267 gc:universal NODE_143_length_17796_cov_0.252020:5119-4319(-)